ncbi:hypothetical protein EDD22DRAFT_961660 [Suillus occidentalis]|nr:hypothetical protein EDD22DRAFT_961660 [Suillus occidentalis]
MGPPASIRNNLPPGPSIIVKDIFAMGPWSAGPYHTGCYAQGEHHDTLVHYLLNKLHAYEADYSNALAPISRGANNSLAGENVLVSPASTEELRLVHASVTADINCLCNDIGSINNSLHSLMNVVVQAACTTATAFQHLGSSQRFAVVPGSKSHTSHTPSLSPSPTYYVPPRSLLIRGLRGHPAAATHSPSSSSTGITGTSQNDGAIASKQRERLGLGHPGSNGTLPSTRTTSQHLPTHSLVIPQVPFVHANGTTSPKNRSWKDIVEHWLIGDPNRGLKTPLKDWPKEWYQGVNRQFASKYHQRLTIALEFINDYRYDSNETRFLAAYPEAELGHTQLLKAINEACTA